MTKVYVIEVGNGQYLDTQGFTPIGYRTTKVHNVTSDLDKSKQYNKEGIAKGVVSTQITHRQSALDYYTKKLKEFESCNEEPPDWAGKNIEDYRNSIDFLKTLTVKEVEVAKPNYDKPKRGLKFKNWGFGVFTKKSQANLYCKGCGMYFVDVPMLIFGTSKPARVCPYCILESVKDAEHLIEEMGEERSAEIEAERFAQRLG